MVKPAASQCCPAKRPSSANYRRFASFADTGATNSFALVILTSPDKNRQISSVPAPALIQKSVFNANMLAPLNGQQDSAGSQTVKERKSYDK
ncbi:hypothetical protein [Undibacterium sp. Ji49W]|uniref:hypothetical protein n=1 Tax=Undibacterium sp. Ji49W TaxID=3413040 RepID=UPI003BF0AC6D